MLHDASEVLRGEEPLPPLEVPEGGFKLDKTLVVHNFILSRDPRAKPKRSEFQPSSPSSSTLRLHVLGPLPWMCFRDGAEGEGREQRGMDASSS